MGSRRPAAEAVIPAAGLGMRFRPFTLETPKPAIPFLNRPLLHWILDELESSGVGRVHINLHHLPDLLWRTALEYEGKLEISSYREPQILGTAGLFGQMLETMRQDSFIVANGDIFFRGGIRQLLKEMSACPSALATLAVMDAPPGAGYTRLDVSPGGDLLGFGRGEKVFSGIYAARKRLFSTLDTGSYSELVKDVLQPALDGGCEIRTVQFEGLWYDLGTPESYIENSFKVLDLFSGGQTAARGWPPAGSNLESRGGNKILLHATAEICRGAEIVGPLILGAGARVESGARVGRSVLWEGAAVRSGDAALNSIVSSQASCSNK